MNLINVPNPGLTCHLALDNPTLNPALARRLPPTLAFRYHALPVAEDNGYITVAMADPDDAAACAAIAAALGTQPYLVRGAPERIDALLREVWPEVTRHPLHWLVCAPAGGVQAYVQYMGGLLGSHPDYSPTDENLTGQAWHGCDLILLWNPDLPLVERALSNAEGRQAGEARPALLVVRRPRWPVRKVLLIIDGEAAEDVSVNWTIRLARPSAAAVTILAIAPPILGMDHKPAYLDHGTSALLTTNTALGRRMRRAARRLLNWEIEGKLRLRQGPLEQQIRLEVAEGDYDLIVAAAGPDSGRLPGGVAGPLLRWADQPVLMTQAARVSI